MYVSSIGDQGLPDVAMGADNKGAYFQRRKINEFFVEIGISGMRTSIGNVNCEKIR